MFEMFRLMEDYKKIHIDKKQFLTSCLSYFLYALFRFISFLITITDSVSPSIPPLLIIVPLSIQWDRAESECLLHFANLSLSEQELTHFCQRKKCQLFRRQTYLVSIFLFVCFCLIFVLKIQFLRKI